MSRPGFIVDGTIVEYDGQKRLEFDNPAKYRVLLGRLKCDRVTVTIEKEAKAGSAKQRGYYFAVIVPAFAEYWGVDDDDAHDLLKANCNKKTIEVVNKQTGEVEEQTVAGSTAGFTAEQWTLYIDRCQRWGATDFGFVVPEADKEHTLHRYERETAAN